MEWEKEKMKIAMKDALHSFQLYTSVRHHLSAFES